MTFKFTQFNGELAQKLFVRLRSQQFDQVLVEYAQLGAVVQQRHVVSRPFRGQIWHLNIDISQKLCRFIVNQLKLA